MSDHTFQFSTTPETLLSLPVQEAVAASARSERRAFGSVFFQKAGEAEASAPYEAANGWRLLAHLSNMCMQVDNVAEPFRPELETSNGRSLLPQDLDVISATAVRDLGKSVEIPELKALFLDIAWVRLRDAEAARIAVHSYIDAANCLFDAHNWVEYVERTERALRLAVHIRDRELVDWVLREIERRVIDLNGSDPLYMTARLMELLQEFEFGEPDQMTKIAHSAVSLAETEGNYERARSHLERIRRWRRMAGDEDGERDARIKIAKSYEKQADIHSENLSGLISLRYLEKAHEAYRNIRGMREQTTKVYRRLRSAQRRSMGAFQPIKSDGIDISESIKVAREHISGKSAAEALLAFATVTRPTDFHGETERAREMMARFPLQSLFGGTQMDRDGRVIAHKQQEQALWERVVEQVDLSHKIFTEAAILPALNQLTFEHRILIRDLRDVVVDNPFVPEGREELFAQAFLSGFHWKFPESMSILVPQIENSLRHLLERSGVEITTRHKIGLQPYIQLGTILNETRETLDSIITTDVRKELKVLFNDQNGPDLRNRIAHGLMSYNDYFNYNVIYAWWLIFFMCINPVYRRFKE